MPKDLDVREVYSGLYLPHSLFPRLEQQMDKLAIFTTPASPGYEMIRELTRDTEAFYAWTPGIAVPERDCRGQFGGQDNGGLH